jgi:hypothetical protein
MLSIHVNDDVSGIPKKLVLQVKKSVLKKAASGKLSNQQAMDEIKVKKLQ